MRNSRSVLVPVRTEITKAPDKIELCLACIMREEFKQRRDEVLAQIHPGVLVLAAAKDSYRNHDVHHEFRQDSDFWYLTGLDEPDSVLVLSSNPPHSVLFVRAKDPEREVWDGPRVGIEGAKADLGVDEAFPFAELAQKLPDLLQNKPRLFYRVGKQRSFDDVVFGALDRVRARQRIGVSCPDAIIDSGSILHPMRSKKRQEELAFMRTAVEISREAHVEAMRFAQPGQYEYEVNAVLRHVFQRRGAVHWAYQPIVGSGPNATILHYPRYDRKMLAGDLLLIDAGCEYEYYAADITRTFPVSGRFNDAQKVVYEVVLQAQNAAIAAATVGGSCEQVHDVAVEALTRGMIELGLIKGPLSEALAEKRYRPFYMHRTSHYLGLDVHDAGAYFQAGVPLPLEPGMVITVEPGMYISQKADVPEAFRGIGVRIEDDVLVTVSGPEVLTAAVPKTVQDVEHACRN